MTLFKRGRVWWFDFWFNGQRHQKSTKERNRNKASTIAAGYRTALANRRVGIVERPPVPLFGEAIKAFLEWSKVEHKQHPRTYQRYKVSSKALSAFTKFNGKPIDQIVPALVEDYKAHRAKQSGKKTKRPITPATINRELACLKAMYFHALKDRHDFGNPVSGVDFLPENNEQNRVLTFEEQRKYLAVASGTLRDVASLILETGMRPEEVYRIRVENVYPDQGYLFNPFGKTKAAKRKIPLNAAALAIVTRRLKAAKGAYLFPHRKDRDKAMLKVNNAHSTALRKSTVRAFRIYEERHTWATRAAESGQVDPTTPAALLGHSKLNMVMRYAHPQEQHQAEAVKKLAAANAAKEIAEFEKRQNRSQTPVSETVPTVSPTVSQNPGNSPDPKNEGNSSRIN